MKTAYVAGRRAILEKTDGFCWYCGCRLTDDGPANQRFTIEHKLPVWHGGTDDFENLVPACRSCNSRKGTSTVEQYRRWLAWKAVGLDPLTENQKGWLLARGVNVDAMMRHEFEEQEPIVFYGETLEE